MEYLVAFAPFGAYHYIFSLSTLSFVRLKEDQSLKLEKNIL